MRNQSSAGVSPLLTDRDLDRFRAAPVARGILLSADLAAGSEQ